MGTLFKSFLFKLEPNGAQARECACSCGCSRYVYNRGLAWLIEQREQNPEFRFSYFALTNLLTQWKQEEDKKWLAECHSQVLQQSLKDLVCAVTNFREGRANFPKFHKKFKSKDSFRYPQGFKIDEGKRQIYLPKTGWVKYHRSRFIAGKSLHCRQGKEHHCQSQSRRLVCFDSDRAGSGRARTPCKRHRSRT